MCFSPAASFTVSGLTGFTGLLTLTQVETKKEVPFSLLPLFFCLQQALEGLLWLTLPLSPEHPQVTTYTQIFLYIALVFWPIYAPFCVFLMEEKSFRRKLIGGCWVMGLATGLYFSWSLSFWPRTASIFNDHIVYSSDPFLPKILLFLYPVATCVSFVLSSHSVVRLLGFVIYSGSLLSYFVYWNSFTSVWCFFAASASVLVFWQLKFYGARRTWIST